MSAFEARLDARGEVCAVLYHDDRPGNCVQLIDPEGRSLPLCSLSQFDDAHRKYTWAFEWRGALEVGQRFQFSTADRAVAGVVRVDGAGARWIEVEGGAPVASVARVAPRPAVWVARAVAAASGAASPSLGVALPKVSVLTCTYDRPDLLRQAVLSLRAQTDPDWEHLIYDDASTHPSVEKVLRWAEGDPRVRVWRGAPPNINRPAARWNFLADRARGRYLTVLDDDNRKLPRFVEVMAGALDADPAAGVATCGFVVENERAQRVEEHRENLRTSPEVLASRSTCDGGATLYRREVFEAAGYFSEAIRTNEDWDWLRRAAQFARFVNLPECLATYRMHGSNRMLVKDALGHAGDEASVRSRPPWGALGVRVVRPAERRLTRSQVDASGSVDRAIAAIPWVHPGDDGGCDLAVFVMPFQLEISDLRVEGCRRVLTVHFEDPYALDANLERVRHLASRIETWVCTNDASVVSRYREVVGERVVVCPMLGADEGVVEGTTAVDRDVDVLLCGYPYPSRRKFMEELLPRLVETRERPRVLLVGDGWREWLDNLWATTRFPHQGAAWFTEATQDLASTYAWHVRARAVVCLHRSHGDCSDGPVRPVTLNRGYMEGALGPRVFVDRSRPHRALDPGDVVEYDGPADLAEKLRAYLGGSRAPEADVFQAKCRQIYTYRERVARVINCVRSPRRLAEVP